MFSNSAQTGCIPVYLSSQARIFFWTIITSMNISSKTSRRTRLTLYHIGFVEWRTKQYFLSLRNFWRTTRRSTRQAKFDLRPDLEETSGIKITIKQFEPTFVKEFTTGMRQYVFLYIKWDIIHSLIFCSANLIEWWCSFSSKLLYVI